MRLRSIFAAAGSMACLLVSASAQDTQKRAEEMLAHARSLSDIHAPNSPPFRMKTTFSFAGANLDTVEGTYTEIWVSDSQWRREIAVGDLLQIEVSGARDKFWRLNKGSLLPERATEIADVMQFLPEPSAKFEFESISTHTDAETSADCAVTIIGSLEERHAFCFDKKGGFLLETISPKFRLGFVFFHSCDYGGFKKFGDRWFPREVVCNEERHKRIEARVTDLRIETAPDPVLFAPPNGAIELGMCASGILPPVVLSAFRPAVPFEFRGDEIAPVIFSVVVGVEGKPADVRLVKLGRKNLDDLAHEAVRHWRFKPSTCDGVPIPSQISVGVVFRERLY